MRYPRDMHGYGADPPDADWPGGARIAVQFVLNYEEGGENNILHGDAASEAFLSEIVGAAPWPGSATGTWNRSTNTAPAPASGGCTRLFTAPRHAGHRLRRRHRARPLARAGRRHAGGRLGDRQPRPEVDRLPDHTREAEARRHRRGDPPPHRGHRRAPARLVHRPLLGQHRRPRHRGGRLRLRLRHLRRRPALLARACRPPAADHPLHARRQRHALRHAAGLQLRRPVLRLPQGQLRHPLRRGRGRQPEDDVGRPALPPGRPPRPRRGARPLRRLRRRRTTGSGSRAASTSPGTGPRRHPAPAAAARPSEMDRADFVARFGGVFEHSPWIAERAHALELGPAHDTAVGLHSALARVFRSASERRAARRADRPPRPRRQARRGQAADRRSRPPSRPAPASTR